MVVKEHTKAVWSTEHLRLAVNGAPAAVWNWNVKSNSFSMFARGFELWGLPWSKQFDFEQLSTHIHPADRDRVRAAFIATRSVSGPYEIDFRIMLADEVKWMSARGRGADEGIIDNTVSGIFLDVTKRKQVEEGKGLSVGKLHHRPKKSPKRFDVGPDIAPILATALDAVAVMTPEGVIAGWNEVAERTFGWSWAEAEGRTLGEMIVPIQHREAHRKGLERLATGGKPHVLNRRIEITALRKDGFEIPVELSITTTKGSNGPVFIGFLRDISERRQAEAKIQRQALENRLMFELSSMAAESESFEEALQKALEAICAVTGWPVGHAFVISPGDQNVLRSSGVWVEAELGMATLLRNATETHTFRPGVGLPGTILASGKPQWVTDTDSDGNFLRKHCGFRGAFGFPLKQDGRVIAILEFFSASPAPPEPELMLTVRALGEQVGRVFERKRTQDHQGLLLHEMNHRVKNILSVVQGIALQTFRAATTLEGALEVFSGRLRAVADAQDVLVSDNEAGATLGEIINRALKGSGVSPERVKTKGPEITVSSRNAVMISLGVHELCTNAFKYGSLLNDDGLVLIEWGLDTNAANFYFEWREVGGPKVTPPHHKGFGSSLLERGLASQLGGQITLDYDPAGVVCRFTGSVPEGISL